MAKDECNRRAREAQIDARDEDKGIKEILKQRLNAFG